ncbi:MAG TPA: glycoside hydrolase family 97 protein [Flavisolibacter sp.]|jgi:alpha-glucosidase
MQIKFFLASFTLFFGLAAVAQTQKTYNITSADGAIQCTVNAGPQLTWSVTSGGQTVIAPSVISMRLLNGETLGKNMRITSAKQTSVNAKVPSPMYKKDTVADQYNQLTIVCKGDYGITFRAYNDGVAYRFFTTKRDSVFVQSEEAAFVFDNDYTSLFPYANDPRDKKDLFQTSFEAFYEDRKLSQQLHNDTMALLPVLINLANGKKAVITEAHLENYPGMYLGKGENNSIALTGRFPAYPAAAALGGYNNINYIVTGRENFIAKTAGTTTFPWRTVIIANTDAALANSDMVFKLAAPNRIKDMTWVKPGKVAWDWWNARNISGVDFKSGINTATYKYFIDFAAANKLEYVILDGGWSARGSILQVNPNLDLPDLIRYGKGKGVDLILWASWSAMMKQMDTIMSHYAAMGVKGFKIDFIDRDDQWATASTYEIAAKGAQHKLLIDLHGMYKPEGLSRTYPNVVNYEGVKGLENSKWAPVYDAPKYDVTIPFIRMLAGPMDYTPGALHNVTTANFMPSNAQPMSQGTRCHQMAMYTIFESPLQMLSDNPTDYMREQPCTDFIAKVPTVFNETSVLDGKVGEFVAIARRKGDVWFVGAMTNWTERDLTIDLSFLKNGAYEAEIFMDGVNADRKPEDYKKVIQKVSAADKWKIHLAPGGGWTARIYPAK